MTGMLKTGSSGVEEGMYELHQDGHPYLTARSDVCIIQYRYSANNELITQGQCCKCNRKSSSFNRAMTFQKNCMGHREVKVAHCMEMSPLM